MKTLLLDQVAWDLVLDVNGDIALAGEPYAQAQDAASEIRTFRGEVYYVPTRGIPYFEQILGRAPSVSFFRAQMVAAALTVPGVTSAVCYLSDITARRLSGQVLITNSAGETQLAGF